MFSASASSSYITQHNTTHPPGPAVAAPTAPLAAPSSTQLIVPAPANVASHAHSDAAHSLPPEPPSQPHPRDLIDWLLAVAQADSAAANAAAASRVDHHHAADSFSHVDDGEGDDGSPTHDPDNHAAEAATHLPPGYAALLLARGLLGGPPPLWPATPHAVTTCPPPPPSPRHHSLASWHASPPPGLAAASAPVPLPTDREHRRTHLSVLSWWPAAATPLPVQSLPSSPLPALLFDRLQPAQPGPSALPPFAANDYQPVRSPPPRRNSASSPPSPVTSTTAAAVSVAAASAADPRRRPATLPRAARDAAAAAAAANTDTIVLLDRFTELPMKRSRRRTAAAASSPSSTPTLATTAASGSVTPPPQPPARSCANCGCVSTPSNRVRGSQRPCAVGAFKKDTDMEY
ncbi:hypothetical protein HK405_006815 [Cladochytrium tenue]|nr:hypothetical protein HK405_006815 [Cladochytrium tenue]